MTAVHTRAFQQHRPRRPVKFDPLRVKIGIGLLALTAFGFGALASGATNSLDDVAVPVSNLCREGGPAGAQLAERGVCAAADQAQQVGPYFVQGSPGSTGAAGDRGPAGADSQVPGPGGQPGAPGANSTVPGSPGKAGEPGADSTVPGAAGQNGTNGVSPACLSEPGQCRGEKGEKGDPGTPGADSTVAGPQGAQGDPGPACPSGTSLQPVTFASGQEGLGCVKPADSEEGMP
jgi:hypothetical protein